MTEATFTFRVEEELKSAFAEVAKTQDRTSAQLLRVLMRKTVEHAEAKRGYEEWFDREVETALREADDPATEWIPRDVVKQDWDRQRAELLARIESERK